MNSKDFVVLTGAGASVPVGIPAMGGMASEFKKHVKGTGHESTYELLLSLGASQDIEDLLQIASEVFRFSAGPLKKLSEGAVAPREGKALSDFRRRIRENVNDINQFRSALIRWISQRCLDFERERADFLYGEMLAYLESQSISVFTTNYDAVFEEVALRRRIRVSDNFLPDEYGRLFWDDSLFSYQGEGLNLINIHGSIRWHASEDGRVEKIPQPAEVNREGQQLEQLLIFPTRFKDIYRRQFFPLYTMFTRALVNAELILVIGHSLRDEYLLAAIRERLRSGGFKLILVDPAFSAEKELRNSVGDSQWNDGVLHIRRPFEEARPIVNQIVKERSVEAAFSKAKEAVDLLRRGRKDKIEIKKSDLWVDRGQSQETMISIDTVKAGGVVRLWIDIDQSGKRRIDLPIKVDGVTKDWAIDGVIRDERKVFWDIPSGLPAGSYKLTAVIQNANNFVLARDERTIKVKK